MTSAKIVFRKAKEIHYKLDSGNRQVPVERIASELQLSHEEVNAHLISLQTLRLVRFKDKTTNDMVEVTKIGLSTQVG
jgi:RIO-like serine/threonine protein kinase